MGRNLGVEYKMRMSQELKDKIAESAKELNRSMNADIVARLEESFEQKSFESLENVPTEDLMKELAKRLDGFSVVAK
ncbi:hypothetical protein F975_01872 [Acinetobacter sp. ANC 3789]|uniref:Arc family DNA-binding protein n=1 Tax=Acinetobacter sp. ANC 3789 TaxID=1217714 RepID=UPI0002CD8609|nr:Arc family DNA-binding protein [Acinetobacter sp. ANC 3789]ENU80119.1 hypothetical protein F975_01872 [Acinetobacter sp. ANC 3789]